MNEQLKQIDLSGYDVVRQEYGSGQNPQLVFHDGRICVNSIGLKQFPECDYVQFLVDRKSKCVVIKPSKHRIKDSFKWCTTGKYRSPRHMKCIPLFFLIYKMMSWDLFARYSVTGEVVSSKNGEVLLFRLIDAISYVLEDEPGENGGRKKTTYFPKQWEGNFGIPMMEYENRKDLEVFDGIAVFNVELDVNPNVLKQITELKNEKKGENVAEYE